MRQRLQALGFPKVIRQQDRRRRLGNFVDLMIEIGAWPARAGEGIEELIKYTPILSTGLFRSHCG